MNRYFIFQRTTERLIADGNGNLTGILLYSRHWKRHGTILRHDTPVTGADELTQVFMPD